MDKQTDQKTIVPKIIIPTPEVAVLDVVASEVKSPREFKKNIRSSGPTRGGGSRGPGGRTPREYDQKILNIRRVARVAAGGRRFNFSVAIVIGNKKGLVGVGTGKASDTAAAIDKAVKNAKKNMINLNLTKNMSISHQVDAKYSSAIVTMMPARGKGIIAGSAVRDVFDLGGVRDINAKILSGSKNKLNIARATIKALSVFAKK
ncbi:MAG: 30S ribosomal protein S5 [Candidatus Paceibacterota bacterium]